MIWPRKNPSSSSSSGVSSLTEALFPISWLSKFKQMSRKSNSPPAKTKRKTKPSSPINPCLPATAHHDIAGKKIQSVSTSILYNTHDELDVQFPFSSRQSCRELNTREDDHMFSDMVSNIRKMRVANDDDQEWKQEHLLLTPRPRIQKGRHRKVVDRGLEELYSDSSRESVEETLEFLEKNMSDLQAIRTMEGDFEARKSAYISSYHSIIAQHGEKYLKREDTGKDSWKQVSKSEKQRKSVHVSRGKHNTRVKHSCKVKAYSPKTAAKVEFCKIKALEDMKKAKMKKKATSTTQGQPLESFAVVKSSFDPCKDFRDSMMEMIEENCIWEAQELEDLLACYLSLNSNEYHHLIVKVFRQVWFEMNKDCSSHELPNNDNCI